MDRFLFYKIFLDTAKDNEIELKKELKYIWGLTITCFYNNHELTKRLKLSNFLFQGTRNI